MHRRVDEHNAPGQTLRLLGREDLVEGGFGVRREIVEHDPDPLGLQVDLFAQAPHGLGKLPLVSSIDQTARQLRDQLTRSP
jgi:hypothetical protein